MRILGSLCAVTLFLFLFLLAPAPSYSQEESKPGQPQEEKDKARHDDNAAKPDKGKQTEAPPAARQEERRTQPEASRPQERQQQEQRPAQNMQRNQQRPAAQQGKHIPDDQFRAHFGRQHTFHVQRAQVVNVSQPVIVYGGYSFQLVEAWPADWGFDDDCYVDYVDGEYFLFDALHPGMRIAVFVIG